MTSRERIHATCAHREPDRLAVDFGGGFQTGIHVSVVYQLRRALGLDKPGTPVKVVEPYQMLGEVAPDLAQALGVDTACLAGAGTLFGYPATGFKEWKLFDGTPVLVPGKFNTAYAPSGELFQYPSGDETVAPCAKMPAGGYFFDALIRQEEIREERLDPRDNMEEFVPVAEAELALYRDRAQQLHTQTDRALFCTFGGLTFGDIALVPGTFLKAPKGIRDIEEWYVSLVVRPDYVKAVFEHQSEVAVQNLARLYEAVGDRVGVIQTNGTDFGTQNGPFCSAEAYRDLYLPYQKKVNGWIHAHTPWKTFMHCCGGVMPLLDLIVEAEFDILNPVQCSAAGMDARTLKKRYGGSLTFWGGGVDTQHVLPFGTPEQVKEQVKERIDIFAPGGGFVFNAIHNVQALTPIQNILALFETVRAYQ